ncbi:MAG: hypothetical protein ACRDH2_18710, partial [Anaerolineales bacterium]
IQGCINAVPTPSKRLSPTRLSSRTRAAGEDLLVACGLRFKLRAQYRAEISEINQVTCRKKISFGLAVVVSQVLVGFAGTP